MNIGTVAEITGLSAKTIRYYESVGLMPQPARRANNYRDYGTAEVETLRFVQRSRRLGFSLEDVANLLALWQNKERSSADVKSLALRHVTEIERRIRELEAMRSVVIDLAERCRGDDRPECPILEGLAAGGAPGTAPKPRGAAKE